jgi:transposase-like protein
MGSGLKTSPHDNNVIIYRRYALIYISVLQQGSIQFTPVPRTDVTESLDCSYVSTRRVQDISQELGEKVDEFLKFQGPRWREVCNKALLVVTGVREDGYREILGAKIADSEDEGFWSGLFDELKERGLEGVKLVVSDGHKGIQNCLSVLLVDD